MSMSGHWIEMQKIGNVSRHVSRFQDVADTSEMDLAQADGVTRACTASLFIQFHPRILELIARCRQCVVEGGSYGVFHKHMGCVQALMIWRGRSLLAVCLT